jgi:hypothetical protein
LSAGHARHVTGSRTRGDTMPLVIGVAIAEDSTTGVRLSHATRMARATRRRARIQPAAIRTKKNSAPAM